MKKIKLQQVEVFPERRPDGTVGIATFDPEDLPSDLKLQSKSSLAKNWRKWKAYERIWNVACRAYEDDDRDSAYFTLKKIADPADFMLHLIEYYTQPTNTSKAGGEAKNAILFPYRNRARRLYEEKKLEHQHKGKSYSQKQFANWFRKQLIEQHATGTARCKELRDKISEIDREIALGGLTASELKQRRESKRNLQEELRIAKPVLPSEKTISDWLSGL